MYDNKSAIEEAAKFIEMHYARKCIYQPGEVSDNGIPFEWLTKSHNWVNYRLDYERDFGVGTQEEQREWFNFLLEISRDSRVGGTQSISKFMLIKWAAKSQNLFATAYHEGHTDGNINGSFYATKRAKLKAEKAMLSKVRKAANGRRLIGASTRERVAKEAEALRHKTKDDASYEIAKIIGKGNGTVKRYLTELYPGDKWKTTNQ